MDDYRPIGECLPALLGTTETAWPEPSIDDLDLTKLPARLDDPTLARVEVIAQAPLPTLPPCDEGHFSKCLRVMVSVLPKRASDETSGELFVAAYQRMLGHYPKAAINHLSEQAILRCKWFPTVSECLEIIGEWRRRDAAVDRQFMARQLSAAETHLRFTEAMDALALGEMEQQRIDALPERWKRIASEKFMLWRHPDGSFTLRRPK